MTLYVFHLDGIMSREEKGVDLNRKVESGVTGDSTCTCRQSRLECCFFYSSSNFIVSSLGLTSAESNVALQPEELEGRGLDRCIS